MKIPTGLEPYLGAIKWGAILLICALLIGGGMKAGCTHATNKSAKTIAQKDAALAASAESLRAAGVALRAVNAEAERKIAEAKEGEKANKAAAIAAEAARRAEEARNKDFAERLARAGRAKPGCAAILSVDVQKECGL